MAATSIIEHQLNASTYPSSPMITIRVAFLSAKDVKRCEIKREIVNLLSKIHDMKLFFQSGKTCSVYKISQRKQRGISHLSHASLKYNKWIERM